MATKELWYAIRTAPGAQVMARALPIAEDETEERKLQREKRRGESHVERNLRNGDINVYMPGFWSLSRNPRTNKLKERRLPLLVGYAFVLLQEGQFERVRNIDGVTGFIRHASALQPIVFPETDIGGLMFAEFERQKIWEWEREDRLSLAQTHRRNQLNKRLGLIVPKGRKKKVPVRMMAEAAIESLSSASKQQVRQILNELNAMDKEMEACRVSSISLYSAA